MMIVWSPRAEVLSLGRGPAIRAVSIQQTFLIDTLQGFCMRCLNPVGATVLTLGWNEDLHEHHCRLPGWCHGPLPKTSKTTL